MEKKRINKSIFADAVRQSFKKLSPRIQVKNPVMLVVYLGAILTTAFYVLSFLGIKDEKAGYTLTISLILGSPYYLLTSRNPLRRDGGGHRQPACEVQEKM